MRVRVVGTAANMSDPNMAGALLHGQEQDVFADAGYQGALAQRKTPAVAPPTPSTEETPG